MYLVFGINARNNLGVIDEENDQNDEDTWIGGVSRMHINDNNANGRDCDDGSTCVQSAFRSVRVPSSERRSSRKNPSFRHTNFTLVNPFIVDYWKDATPNMRVSVQFQVNSGVNSHKKLEVRVSTDGLSLIVSTKSSKYVTDTSKGILAMLVKKGMDLTFAENTLKYHPRIIARKSSVSLLNGRDTQKKELEYEFRIPLAYKCRHKVATRLDGDEFFYGLTYFEYGNGEVWCHCELITHVSDDYTHERVEPDLEMMEASCASDESSSDESGANVYECYNADEDWTVEADGDTVMTDGNTRVTRSSSAMRTSSTPKTAASKKSVLKKSTPAKKSTPSKSSKTSKNSTTSASQKKTPSKKTHFEKPPYDPNDSYVIANQDSYVAPPLNVIYSPAANLKKGSSLPSSKSTGMSFMTPNDYHDDESIAAYSVDNSTIRTLDTFHDNRAIYPVGNALAVLKKSVKTSDTSLALASRKSDKSAKSRSRSSSRRRSSSRSKSTSRSHVTIPDDDVSRSGRSSSGSQTSKSSDTPTTKNVSTVFKKFFGPLDVMDTMPQKKIASSYIIPKNVVELDQNARITRSAIKRASDTKSASSDESHQNATQKYHKSK